MSFFFGGNLQVIKSNDWVWYFFQVKLDEEETSNFRDRLLPFIIGLLRTVSYMQLSLHELSIICDNKHCSYFSLMPRTWTCESYHTSGSSNSVNNYVVLPEFCLFWIYLLKLIIMVHHPLNFLWLHYGFVSIQILNICCEC